MPRAVLQDFAARIGPDTARRRPAEETDTAPFASEEVTDLQYQVTDSAARLVRVDNRFAAIGATPQPPRIS
jgi:hypothetical protein